MSSVVVNRALAQLRDPLLRSAYSLMLNTAVTAVLGMAFWIAAARLFPARSVGRDAALIALMMELSTLARLNMENALARFLPTLGARTGRTLLGVYAVTTLTAVAIGLAFVAVAPAASAEFAFLTDDTATAAVYVVAIALWGLWTLLDVALPAMRRAPWVPVSNGIYSLLKLGTLVALGAGAVTHGVLLAWTLPLVVVLVPMNWMLFRRFVRTHVRDSPPDPSPLRSRDRGALLRYMAQDYGATVLARGGTSLLPLVVVAVLGSRENAYFYIAFTLVLVFDMLFHSVGVSLVVEGARAGDEIRALAVRVVRRFAALLLGGVVVMVAAAPLLLLPFGPEYVRESAPVLRLLACASLFRGVIVLYSALARVRGQGGRILAAEGAATALLIAAVFVLAPRLGIEGVALAWLGANAVVALAVLPALVRTLLPVRPSPPPTPLSPV